MWVIKCCVGYFESPGQGVTGSFESAYKYTFSEMEIGSNRHFSELKIDQEFDDDLDDWDLDDDWW